MLCIRWRPSKRCLTSLNVTPDLEICFHKLEKVTYRVDWGVHNRHGALFCRPREKRFFYRWLKEVGESLCQVYRAKQRLCWEINRYFSKIFIFLLYRLSNYIGPPSSLYFTFFHLLLVLFFTLFLILINIKRTYFCSTKPLFLFF